MRLVAVFDTNILLSGIGWGGKPYRCLELARSGIVEGITCQGILDELSDKLQTKLAFSDVQIADTLADLLAFLRSVTITGSLKPVSADPDDDKVIECAQAGKATHIVTGDRRHLIPLRRYEDIQIVTAAEFLALVEPPFSRG